MIAQQSLRQRVWPVWRGPLSSPGAPAYVALVGVFAIASFLVGLKGYNLLAPQSVNDILTRSVALGIVAVGQTLVIICASLDLSVAYMVSVSAVLASVEFQGDTSRTPIAVGAALGMGAVVGLANGLAITKLGVHPFIATLGMALILQSAIYTSVNDFSGTVPHSFQNLAYGKLGPVDVPIALFAGIALAAWAMLARTRFGHHLYAVGGSEQTARLSGIRTHRVIIRAHVLCSLAAALAGLFLASRLGSGAPWVGTDGHYDLDSIAAVVLGGAPLTGGKGGVFGTLAGVLIFSILEVTFNDLGFDPFLQNVIRGAIIIAAVASSALRLRRGVRA